MELTTNEISLIGIIINSLVALIAIGTLIYQRIYNTKSLDFNLHPAFDISDFCPTCTKFWTPKLCESSDPNSKHFCPDDHWFDIRNLSKAPAFGFKCFLLHSKEKYEEIEKRNLKTRTHKREALVHNGTLQYKIPIDTIPFKHYNKASTDEMYIVIEYKTVSLKSKFRQIIKLNISPKNSGNQITDWKNSISISLPEVESLKKIHWYQNSEKSLKSELKNISE